MTILFAFLSVALATISIPLHRETSSGSIIKQALSSLSSPRRLLSSSDITNYKNSQYYIQVSIGTPPQTFNLAIDTASSHNWLYGSDCLDCHYGSNFNAKNSTTYRNTTETKSFLFRSGSLNCSLGYDAISIGDSNSLTAANQPVYVAYSWDSESKYKADGALGFSLVKQEDGVNTIMSSLKNQGLIQNRQFAIYLNGANSYSNLPDHGSSNLMIDGFNLGKYSVNSDFTYINLYYGAGEGWNLISESIYFAGKLNTYNSLVAIDTSVNKIIGPHERIEYIFEVLNCSFAKQDYSCLCNGSYPKLSFQFSDYIFDLDPSDYLIPYGGGLCSPAFDYMVLGYYWILGTVFIRKFYTNFDIDGGRIGFAEIVADSIRVVVKENTTDDPTGNPTDDDESYNSFSDPEPSTTTILLIVLSTVLPAVFSCIVTIIMIFRRMRNNWRPWSYGNSNREARDIAERSENAPSAPSREINEHGMEERKSAEKDENDNTNNNKIDRKNEDGNGSMSEEVEIAVEFSEENKTASQE